MGIKAKRGKDKEEDKVIETDLNFTKNKNEIQIKDKLKNISKMSNEDFETMLNTISKK